jgi:hypothetical protein
VVDVLGASEPSFLQTLLAQRVVMDVTVTYLTPLTLVTFAVSRVAIILLILLVDQLLVLRTIAAVG